MKKYRKPKIPKSLDRFSDLKKIGKNYLRATLLLLSVFKIQKNNSKKPFLITLMTLFLIGGLQVTLLALNESSLTNLGSQNFNYTGGNQTYNLPANTGYVKVKLWGAGGGNAANNGYGYGGPGGYTESIITIPSGTTSITVIVGKGGQKGTQTGDGYGGGGGSGNDGGNSGGQGGGRSAIIIGSNEVLTAGGGGGGGYGGSNKYGGVGGGLKGTDGYNSGNEAGRAATQTGAGAKGTGSVRNGEDGGVGNQWQGGRGSITGNGWGGGGGGGGYYGGGGGGGTNGNHGPGGGGSGFVGRNGSSALSGDQWGSANSTEDANGRKDTVTNITYYNSRALRGDINDRKPIIENGNYGRGGDNGNGDHGRVEIVAYKGNQANQGGSNFKKGLNEWFSGIDAGYFNDNCLPCNNNRWFEDRNPARAESVVKIIDKGDEGHEYSYRWTGYFIPPQTGRYYFKTASDDSSRLFIKKNGS
ncbi:MAG: hypothetical protein CMP21_05385, partial [Rickettsiales bacterium]|nr:hypothetical protein [Rickettsiales bacterium]